jgi:hypothetical protein
MKLNLIFMAFLTAGLGIILGVAQSSGSLEGKWEGALGVAPNRLRIVLNISKASDGLYIGRLISLDQGGIPIPMENVRLTGDAVHFDVKAVNGVFEGKLSEPTKIEGKWSQGGPVQSLEFTRTAATADTPKAPDPAVVSAAILNNPFGIPMEMTVPVPPTPFPANGKTHLVYELHVTNLSPVELLMTKLEVLSGETAIASFDAGDLNGLLLRPGAPNLTDNRAIGAGMRAIAYLWISLDASSPIPTALRHRLTISNKTLTGPEVLVSQAKVITLGPPLRGANWLAANGPGNGSVHRRALILLNGAMYIAQRFAIDWVQIGPNGRTFQGDDKDNKTHFAYGNDILAVADGVITEVKDGIPENIPGPTSRAVEITPETIGGNHVVMDLGSSHFAFYAHMQPGSLRVKVGDKVRRGQVLGLVGNTGNSTEPHLHFHITNGNSGLGSEGLPYVLESFEVLTGPNTWEPRRDQLPLLNTRVRFPDSR